jgi:hypothetical protein
MTSKIRPNITQPYDISPIENFIAELQEAIDTGDADLFNKRFSKDILWGSPFAAIVRENVAIAYVRKLVKNKKVSSDEINSRSFDELALFILVKENGQWWLVAAQHVPDRRDVYLK